MSGSPQGALVAFLERRAADLIGYFHKVRGDVARRVDDLDPSPDSNPALDRDRREPLAERRPMTEPTLPVSNFLAPLAPIWNRRTVRAKCIGCEQQVHVRKPRALSLPRLEIDEPPELPLNALAQSMVPQLSHSTVALPLVPPVFRVERQDAVEPPRFRDDGALDPSIVVASTSPRAAPAAPGSTAVRSRADACVVGARRGSVAPLSSFLPVEERPAIRLARGHGRQFQSPRHRPREELGAPGEG